MSSLDVLIIKPGNQKNIYADLSAFNLTAIEPPLWACLLAGFLRSKGYSVDILDAEAENLSHEEAAFRIKDSAPLLAIMSVSGSNPSASTMNMTGAENIFSCLKKLSPEIKTTYHGLHPSALPEQTLKSKACADFVCQGEGFYTIPDLIDAIKKGNSNYNIPGLWYQKKGKIQSGSRPPLLKDLDELGVPAWDLLPIKKYKAHNWHCFGNINEREPYGVLFTSLGCPFNCSFCCINAIFGSTGIRFRSPEIVLNDIDFLVNEYHIKNIKIIDELFAVNEKRVIDICDRIIDRKYDLNMWAYARVNTVTPTMLKKMKQAGINWVAYGFESAGKSVLKGVNKEYDPSTVMDIVQMTYDNGLHIGANFIFGLPDDDFNTMQQTLDLAVAVNAEWANFNTAMAYPGSKLHEDALLKKIPLPESWQAYSQYSYDSLCLPTNFLSAGEVLSFRDYAFHTYFENPRYLNRIKNLFGMDTVNHIIEMAGHRLKRKHAAF